MLQNAKEREDHVRYRGALWACLKGNGDPDIPLHKHILAEIAAQGIQVPVTDVYKLNAGITNTSNTLEPRFNPSWLIPGARRTTIAQTSLDFEDHPHTDGFET